MVAAAGNVDHDALVDGLKRGMDTGRVLSRGRSAWSLRAHGRPPRPSGSRLIRNRKTEQAHIMLGTNGLSRSDPDRFAFGIVNAALGGGMSSRLFQEIREQRGLAYSVYSYHQMYAEAGLFAMYSGTTPGRAAEALSLLQREAAEVAESGLTQDEFDRAKGHVKGSMVLSLEETERADVAARAGPRPVTARSCRSTRRSPRANASRATTPTASRPRSCRGRWRSPCWGRSTRTPSGAATRRWPTRPPRATRRADR